MTELLSAGAFLDSCNSETDMAIHWAARWSSCAIVTALLDAKSHVDPRALDDTTPLHRSCMRDDEEASKIVRVLLDRGARLEVVGGTHKQTPLLVASYMGSTAVVDLLLSRRADVRAVTRDRFTALALAVCNGFHGSEMIPLLVKAGVDVNQCTDVNGSVAGGYTALQLGMGANAATMRALAEVYPPGHQLAALMPLPLSSDPIGCAREAAAFGCTPKPFWFATSCQENYSCHHSWAMLRLGGSTIPNTFAALETCQDASLWRWAGLEMFTTRHPDDDCTLLHVAARTNNAAAVQELMAIWMNPLLRNREGRLAAELATDAGIRAELRKYAAHTPRREVMRWHGPYLLQRVRAFLLVLQRWRNVGLRWIPKDLVYMIIVGINEYV